MIRQILGGVPVIFLACLCFAESRQEKTFYIVPGGMVSGSGQVKKVQLGASPSKRSYGKKQHGAADSGKVHASEFNHAPASAKTSAPGINEEFKLSEVYVYPNPAKGGKVPIVHIEVGIADSVKITIYTSAGEESHKHTIAGMPDIISDGNGAAYAYEHAWRGHIPSGVYYYLVEVEKSGKKLRKTGKFAVVR